LKPSEGPWALGVWHKLRSFESEWLGEVVRERVSSSLRLGMDVELAVDVDDVALDGAEAQDQIGADLAVAFPLGDEPQQFHLARGEAARV
jgi:hypothetical protein